MKMHQALKNKAGNLLLRNLLKNKTHKSVKEATVILEKEIAQDNVIEAEVVAEVEEEENNYQMMRILKFT